MNVHHGSILDCQTDAIVNPANSHLHHGGGLARAIADAARDPRNFGPPFDELRDPWDLEQEAHPLIPTGSAGWTSAGRLPFKGIVHAVGPIWGGSGFREHDLLQLAHVSAIRVAREHGCKSLAIPAISCGIFGFPIEEAAPEAVVASHFASGLFGVEVTFALMEDEHVAAYEAVLWGRA